MSDYPNYGIDKYIGSHYEANTRIIRTASEISFFTAVGLLLHATLTKKLTAIHLLGYGVGLLITSLLSLIAIFRLIKEHRAHYWKDYLGSVKYDTIKKLS